MKIEQYKCDVCGAVKGETNHWWIVQSDQVLDATKGLTLTAIHIYPAEEFPVAGDSELREIDLCGQRCVIAKVSELMGEAK